MANIKTLKQFFLISVLASLAVGSAPAQSSDAVQAGFANPPHMARPWVYWVWTADTTPAALTRDLVEMKAKGIAGCILYDVQTGRGVNWWERTVVRNGNDYRTAPTDDFHGAHYAPIPGEPLQSWSPRWGQLVCFASGEAGRLGIDFVVANGLANTSGPISERYGEQKLDWSETSFKGSQTFNGTLPKPGSVKPREWRFHRDVAVVAVPNRPAFSVDEVINLTSRMDSSGHLNWQAPPGDWRIFRFVQAPTGAANQWGFYNDSMSAEAMDETWKVTMEPLMAEMTPYERKALKGIEDDSWEAGKIGWTTLFPEEFQKRRGYDLIPYLPIIAGAKMSDADTRQRVERDYTLTISDLIAENHYADLNKLAIDNNLTFYSEAAGPNFDQADLLKTSSRVGLAMAEFWMPSAHRPTLDSRFLLRNAANANHVYGNNITMCESFTSLGPEWEEGPFDMKPVADQAFCDGLNKICVHNFSQSPSLTAKPGYVYVAGTHYEPGITWWDETPAFNRYLARCSFMLQQGKFVADALFYHGDNIGHGEQRKTVPPTLGEGYDHDNCNSEVLLTRTSAGGGRIELSDGMTYRVLALPNGQPMPLRDLEKIANLVEAGATIVGPPPTGLPGMDFNSSDKQQFDDLVSHLWGGMDGSRVTQKQLGAGQLFWGPTVRQVLQANGVAPDFEETGLSDGGFIDWIHRGADGLDIYYVASRWEHPENVDCAFRVSGKQPELWNPVTGEIRDATAFRQQNGRTIVPLQFGPCGSIFVVFRRSIPANIAGTTTSNYPSLRQLQRLSGPWKVDFDPKWGGPASVVFDELVDWTARPEEGIRYYSGTAVYHKNFKLKHRPVEGEGLILDLGQVHEVAVVRLNGQDLGTVWVKPARVDITRAVRAGGNDLEVTVVNLWPNRLKGDESLPEEKRYTETNIRKFTEASPLLPSGLIGPVSVMAASSGRF